MAAEQRLRGAAVEEDATQRRMRRDEAGEVVRHQRVGLYGRIQAAGTLATAQHIPHRDALFDQP